MSIQLELPDLFGIKVINPETNVLYQMLPFDRIEKMESEKLQSWYAIVGETVIVSDLPICKSILIMGMREGMYVEEDGKITKGLITEMIEVIK